MDCMDSYGIRVSFSGLAQAFSTAILESYCKLYILAEIMGDTYHIARKTVFP